MIVKNMYRYGIQKKYGQFRVENVGSSANGLWGQNSDVDIVIQFTRKV